MSMIYAKIKELKNPIIIVLHKKLLHHNYYSYYNNYLVIAKGKRSYRIRQSNEINKAAKFSNKISSYVFIANN